MHHNFVGDITVSEDHLLNLKCLDQFDQVFFAEGLVDVVKFQSVDEFAGDVLVVATPWPGNAADLAGRADPWPPVGVGRVVMGPGGLDVAVRWLSP